MWGGGHKERVSEAGNCRLYEVWIDLRVAKLALYGSSETGTIAINYPPNQPYITGKVLDGVMVKLENVNKKGIGRLAVKSKGLFLGYWNQEEVCREYYLTGDLVKMLGKNMILILGRCNDIVSISGLKVL